MIELHNTLISLEVIEEHFICDLNACKGACCVEGEAGAPLLEKEVGVLEKELDSILPFIDKKGKELIQATSFYQFNERDKEAETACLGGAQCAFVKTQGNGMITCGIEQAFYAEATDFLKPISCHLYPIRLSKVGNYIALNYHKWSICKAACSKGEKEKIALYQFLKEPLIRAFGAEWYADLTVIAKAYLEGKNG